MDPLSKAALRRVIRERKRTYSPEQLHVLSQAPLSRLEAHPAFRTARVVLAYHSLPDEVDTRAFLRRWCGRKQLLLPVVDGDDLYLAPYEGEAALAAGAFGIGEPTGRRFAAYDTIDVAVVPGLAFDQAGRRLGRGRGYYDRLLPRLRRESCRLLGLCFDFQRVAQVPVDATDVPVDEVI